MLSCFSCVCFFETLWTVARQVPLSMGFSRQEHWSGLPCLSPGDLPDPGISPMSPVSPVLASRFLTTSATWKTPYTHWKVKVKSLSCVWLFATPWTVGHQSPPSMAFPREEYWSGLPFPSPGESFLPRGRTRFSHIAGRCFNLWATREAHIHITIYKIDNY